MYTFIRNLQKKPDNQKRTIIIGLMIVCTMIVGGFWLVSLDSRFARSGVFVGSGPVAQEGAEEASLSVDGPFSSISRSVGAGVASVKEQFAGLQKQFSGSREDEELVPAWPLPVEDQ